MKLKARKFLSVLLCMIMVLGTVNFPALAEMQPRMLSGTESTVEVMVSVQKDGAFITPPHEITVTDGIAEEYGFAVPETDHTGEKIDSPTFLDAMVALHKEIYGEAFTAETAGEYLELGSYGYLGKAFGADNYVRLSYATSEENIRKSAEIVRIAHGMGVGVECELGSVGGLTDSNGKVDQMVYTEPEEAKSFVDQTGTDFLAVSIGTCHGVYKATPKLDIPRLREIRKTVSVPLVLHGGSGLSDDDFRNTVAGGISKINVFTDVILAAKRAIAEHPDAGYTDLNLLAEDAMVEATVRKLELFGGCGKG